MRHHQLSMSDSNVADFFSKGSPASVRQGTLFEIKLNGADFFFFSKLISYPESPGNRPHPHYRLISLALTASRQKSGDVQQNSVWLQEKPELRH
ncbi:hypothetical protein EC2872800_3394 [Escherichia coli 2872800]|nr:hypothetical protein EC2875000_4892 [Escherichia coli 2875000]EMV44780.1 hypothetical protein EC2872800_3394 [Escherichia coli 2872800]EMV66904.1 hypothetical protein EC2866750_5181 [Escherichia coli 2866750]EMV68529.1 hypothetical protein EC2866550_3626 [Escherichia coli 2866550]EMV70294.1 hypothetical protein EC2866450_3379 [Escherichia coli 2866450]EMW00264.1 hypothetical protein EC2853500_3566 [Escherichia coli 2853500]EMW00383.1 hypothetical protein EC2851500_3318 [Escherichia coli 28